METKEEMKKIHGLKNRLINGFSINRIPDKTREWFIKFANEEFCQDRGMALQELVKNHLELQKIKELLYDKKWSLNLNVNLVEKK